MALLGGLARRAWRRRAAWPERVYRGLSSAHGDLLARRSALFDAFAAQADPEGSDDTNVEVRVVSGDGAGAHEATVGPSTRPIDLPWLGDALVASVRQQGQARGELWDLTRPLGHATGPLVVQGHGFDTEEGQSVFWHSSAHVLGAAMEAEFGMDKSWLCDGPPLDAVIGEGGLVGPGSGGFFYDMEFVDKGDSVPEEALKKLQRRARKLLGKVPFERLELSREQALEMFAYNPRKVEMIEKLTQTPGVALTAYRTGDFVDLCRGPHLPDTGPIASDGTKVLRTYSISDGREHRVYGISFPSKALLKDWTTRTAEAAKRDHRVLGKKQELFMFHKLSPGSAFMLPHGTVVYNKLLAMLRDQYSSRGYEEVMTPLIYHSELWQQSGHEENYQDNMYRVVEHECATTAREAQTDKEEAEEAAAVERMGLKPMNCPGHCLVYAKSIRSFRDLPVRLADFSALHRNEATGALGGMTRLRRFHQDDAHIFCLPEQIHGEILDCIDFVRYVYQGLFDFAFEMRLSTRPEQSIGADAAWEAAEAALVQVLDDTKLPWKLDPGEGAFYGPKIDISITDAIGRKHQCATIQLDFQLPERFDLEFTNSGGERERPVMVHRAILGSVERFLAILLEHTNGKLPFWLSPRQVMILPVDSAAHGEYAAEVARELRACCCEPEQTGEGAGASGFMGSTSAAGLCVQVNTARDTLSKRVRQAQQAPFNVILVVGDEEVRTNSVTARSNDGKHMFALPREELVRGLAAAMRGRSNETFPVRQPESGGE